MWEILRGATEDAVSSILKHNVPVVSPGCPAGGEEQPIRISEEQTNERKIREARGSLIIETIKRMVSCLRLDIENTM